MRLGHRGREASEGALSTPYASEVLLADFATDPYVHQLRELERSIELPLRALLWHMRTGKSKTIVDTACHLFLRGKIDAVVLFAPNGVHLNWLEREFPAHRWPSVPLRTTAWRTQVAGAGVLASTELAHIRDEWWEDCRDALRDFSRLQVFAFNSESMIREDVRRVVARVVGRRKCLAVFDEAQDWRRPGSKRSHMARALAWRCPYRRILTGTPVHNSPLHAWSEFELLEHGALGFEKFKKFEEHHAEYMWDKTKRGQRYRKLVQYHHMDQLRSRMARLSSVVRREDCEDMPELVRVVRRIEPSAEQLRVYRELHDDFVVSLGTREVSVGERSQRLNKMQQVMSGWLKDEDGKVHDVPGHNPRLDALSDEVLLAPGKVVIWCRFREDIDRACARLRADGHQVLEYHGRTSSLDKALAREMFAPGAENDAKALVGYPVPGLNFSAASEVIWYSHVIGDALTRDQASDRATMVGGRNIRVTDLVAPGVDEYAMRMFEDKVTLAQSLSGPNILEELRL